VQGIEAAVPRLSRAELEQLRVWFEDDLEDQLELTDEVKAKLDQGGRQKEERRIQGGRVGGAASLRP